MAGEANTSFLPLEGIGNQSGKALVYGISGQSSVLPMLQTAGAVYHHSASTLTVPMQRLAMTMRTGDSFAAALRVPIQTVNSGGGSTAKLAVPIQILAATGTVPNIARAELTVPIQIVSGTGIIGAWASATLQVPMQTLSMYVAGRGAGLVPMQVLAAHGWAMESGYLAGKVPLQRVTGTMSVFSYPWAATLTVPMIVAGPYASAALTVPLQYMAGTFALPAQFEAWVMNLRNGGVTRWTNFPFVQFTRVGDLTYAVGHDGNLYLLGGDLDGALPITWEFETGLEDLGSPGLKHIPYLYMDGIIDGEIEIVLLDDRGREFAYEYDTKQRGAVHQSHRRKLGNGVRTRNVAFRLRSLTGAYIELDSLEPEATITQRSL